MAQLRVSACVARTGCEALLPQEARSMAPARMVMSNWFFFMCFMY